MVFSREDYEKIYNYVINHSVRITDFDSIDSVEGDELFSMVKDNVNYKITFDELFSYGTENLVRDVTLNGNTVVQNKVAILPTSLPASDVYPWAKATTKPSYTASEVGAVSALLLNAANGVATLDNNKKLLASQIPGIHWDLVTNKPNFATVAVSGSYNDLSNKPVIPDAVTEQTVTSWGFTKNTGNYNKPYLGIPKTDLADSVKASLDKADSAVQNIPDISIITAGSGNVVGNITASGHIITVTKTSGGSGTGNYNDLINKPSINGVTLSGNITTSGLGINIPTKVSDLNNDLSYQSASQVAFAVAAETSRATAEESRLENLIPDVDDLATKTELETETTRATAAEGTLTTNLATANTNIGNLTQLQTTAKNNLVAAINEVLSSGGSGTVTEVLVNNISVLSEGVASIPAVVITEQSAHSDYNVIDNIEISSSDSLKHTISVHRKSLAEVAFTGSYNDLENTPSIPVYLSDLLSSTSYRTVSDTQIATWDAKSDFSGNYSDLTGAPSLELIQSGTGNVISNMIVNGHTITISKANITPGTGSVDWDSILNKPTFSTVATTGSFNDLLNKPTVPTALSQLTNDSGFITKSVSDLTNYTLTEDLSDVAFSNDYNDLDNLPTIPVIPTDLVRSTSSIIYSGTGNVLTDMSIGDSGSVTLIKGITALTQSSLTNYALKSDLNAKINEPQNEGSSGQVLSTDGNGNRQWISVSSGTNVVDNLTSTSGTDALSANQGRVLKGLVDGKQDAINDLTAIRSGAADGTAAKTALNGHTVNKDVPSNAVFTDTVYDDTAVTNRISSLEDNVDTWNAKYSKPSTGIPSSDLAAAVQTSLGKADSAYQKPSNGIPSTDLTSSVQASLTKADSAVLSVNNETPDSSGNVEIAVGTTNYNELSNQPKIAGTVLSGDKSLSDLGIASVRSLNAKQDTISDLADIREGASLGATALQSVPDTYRTSAQQDIIDNTKANIADLADVATSGSYNDLSNKPTIPSEVTESTVTSWGFTKNVGTVTKVNNVGPNAQGNVTINIPAEVTEQTVSGWGFTKNTGTYSKPTGGIPKTDLANAVQTSLGYADTANTLLGGHSVAKNVPADAVFTDTVYDDTSITSRVSAIENKESGWNAKLSDAPSDNTLYGRRNGTWTAVTTGTTDYSSLSNKPQIAGTTLEGNKTLAQLGIASSSDLATKQDSISDLSTIRSNASSGAAAATTIASYGNIVTHNTSEFATASQGSKADTALQDAPSDNVVYARKNGSWVQATGCRVTIKEW